MVGVQPPETATRSQPTWRSRPSASPDQRAPHAPAALRFEDAAAGNQHRAGRLRRLARRHGDLGAAVDDGDDLDPRRPEIGDGRGGLVVVGEDHGPPSRRGGEAVEVGPHRAGEHHARPVVAAEDDAALDRPRGEHGALRDDLPGPLPRLVLRRHRRHGR